MLKRVAASNKRRQPDNTKHTHMKKIFFTALIVFLTFLDANAQQDPHYTQYMYNMSIVNPAYAGSKESLSGGILYRKQWVDIEDSPSTGTLFLHSPVGKNVGLGISFANDQIGPVEENNVFADFSYTLNLGGEHKLAFGVKGGATFQNVGLLTKINPSLPDSGDEAFSSNINSTYLNVGAGFFYYTNKYYIAFSVPNMLKSDHLDVRRGAQDVSFGSESLHYFLTGGYVFNLSPNTELKPSAMVKSAFNVPLSFDASLNVRFWQKFELGATYRLDDSVGAMVNYAITPSLRLGYAYDHILSDLNVTTPASHEFMLLFDLNFSKKVSQSPRYF